MTQDSYNQVHMHKHMCLIKSNLGSLWGGGGVIRKKVALQFDLDLMLWDVP